MSRDNLIALGAGLLSALFYLSVKMGSPGAIILAYLSQLPLFVIGLSLGLTPTAIACLVAAAAIAVSANFAAAGLFLYGISVESYWALALPVASLVLFVLGLVTWIGWTILTVRAEAEGDPLPDPGPDRRGATGPGSATSEATPNSSPKPEPAETPR